MEFIEKLAALVPSPSGPNYLNCGQNSAEDVLFLFGPRQRSNKFNLMRALQFGLIPGVYFTQRKLLRKQLLAYVMTYLKEEIAAEGSIRNLGNFHRFLDVASKYSAEILNYDNISREASIPGKTVKGYFEVLTDTLVGFELPACEFSVKKQLVHHQFKLLENLRGQ